MAPRVLFYLASVTILVTVLFVGASAQSSSCTSAIVSLSPCLDFITGNSSTPTSSCCKQLGTMVQSEPQCLCMVINGGASSTGINVNRTQALALPGSCNLQTPPLSMCNESSPPISPSGSSDGIAAKVPVFLSVSLLLAMAYLSLSPTSF